MYQTHPKIHVKCKCCANTSFNLLSMTHQVSSHDGSIEISKDAIEREDCSGIDIYPVSPVFKTPFIAMTREITKENLNEVNLDDLFPKELPQGKQEDGIATTTANEMSWLSPFHNSCLSPIISKKREHLKEVPESLEPLLSKNDVSWTSSLATPHAHNVAWSYIHSGDKKTTSADNFDFLLSCDASPSVTYEKLEITSNNLETSLSKHEEKHRTAMHSTDDTVLYEALFQCVDQGHVIDGIVSNHKKFNSCFQNIDRVMTREQLKRSDKRSLKEGGDKSVIARKLFGTPNNNIYKSKCSINNSQMELLNKNLDSADKDLYVDGKVDVSETVCDLQNESQRTLPTNDYNTQEFFDNLSFGTINEVFQATEILGSAESSPISNIHVESSAKVIQSNENYDQEEKKSKIGKAPNKKLILCRTSTPLNGFSKRNSSCKEITRKKIKFVADVENAHSHTSILDFKEVSSKESDCNFFPQELSKILSQDLTSTEMLQNTQNLTPSSKINAIKNIVSGSKSFVYVHNSNTSKSVITSNSVFNLADLLKEAQILEEGEMIGLKANSSSSEQKKRLENSSIEYSDSDFVSFSKLCKIDDSKAFETLGPCLKENLMIDRIDVHKLPVEHQDIIDDDKIMICDSSCEKNDKIDQGSLVLISSRSKRLRNESNDTSCEFDILKESGDIQDTAKRKCNSTTMFQSKKFLSMRQGEKIHSTCETVDSSECQKFNDVYKEDLVAGNVICWHDVKQHAPKLEMKNISIKIESNQSDTANMSLMDVTDTQLIAADENTNLLLHLTKNGRYSQWTNGFMKQGLHNGSENKVQKICEEYEQLLVQENGFSKQLCDVKDNSKECNSKNTIETIQNKTKVESHCLENNLEKSSSNHISCSENVENLLDSDTVDQLFEESTYFVERNNSKESVKIFPCKDDVAESKNENNTAKVILMETNISNNCIEGLSLVNPLMNYKQNYLKERNICLETAFRKPEPQNHRLASTSEKKLKISDTETVYMGVVKTLNCSENFTKKNENCSVSSESEFAEGPTKKADTPKDSGEEVSVCEEDIKNTQSHYSSESMPETAVVNNGLFISSGEKGNTSKIIMKKVKPLSSESSVLESGPMSCGFTTASGKKIKISEEAMQTARLLLSEENTLEPIEAYVGLCLAGGKEGYFSEQATTVEPYFSEESILKLKFENCGFSTPSRKKVYVSEDTMKQAKSIFAEESTLEVSSEIDRFFIASEKNVDAAMQSVKKATVFFSGESVLMPEVTNCGFSTASGKKVGVSKEALKKAKLFLSEESVLDPRIPNCGFSTASGKKVDVSEQAMKKAKSLFSEESMLELNCGFSTASGKKVGVSEEALKKAKLFLSEESVLEPRIPNCGFSTASGKKVDVSEQAMKKAKSLFSEESLSELCSKNDRFSKTKLKNVDTCEQDMKKLEVFSKEMVLKSTVSSSCSSVAYEKKENIPEVTLEKVKSTFSKDEISEQVVCNFALSTVNTETVDVAKDLVLKNNSKLKLNNDSHAECNTEFNFGEAKNVNSLLLKYSLPVEDIKYCISGHKNRRRTHINSNISSAVVCDAASVYDFSFGTEAMQSHSQSSSSQFKFDVDDNGLKSPVLQRNNLVITCEPSEIPIDTHSPPSPILKSNNSFISKKSQNLDIIYNNTTANFNLSRNQEVARNLFNEKVSDYCKPLCEKSKSVCKITEFVSEISLSQELTEQVTDILLDESSVPLWASSFVTCPDSSGDRFDAPKPVVSSDAGDVLPPVKFDLGCHDRFRTKQPCKSMYKSKLSLTSSKIQRLVSTSLCSNPNEQPSATKKVSFKVPYKDTGQPGCAVIPSAIQPLKNTRKKLAFGTPFSKRLKVSVVDQETKAQAHSVSSDVDVAVARAEAARQQEAQIKSVKTEGEVRLCKGSHLLKKIQTRETQVTWKEAAAGKLPGMYTTDQLLQLGIKEDVIKMTAANAAEYRFSSRDFYSPEVCRNNTRGIAVGDGAQLVLDAAGFAGVEEFTRAFLSSPGVDPSLLLSEKWVANHYRWIVWKLAATDRSFPSLFTSRSLSPNNVMLQLKYRYDREIDRSERPALSRILQRDDAAAKRLVLLVVNILKTEGNFKRDTGPYELELSDGWYSVMAIVDHEMCCLIEAKVLNIGMKLVTYGAELLNCDQGCFPLEAGSEVRLKLHTNSTRRARWYAKLGYHSCSGPIHGSLSSVLPLGGLISCITVVIARVYPLVYVQKVSDGKSVIRNERMEERAAAQFERSRQETVESVLSQVLAQLRQESAYKCKQSPSNHRADKVTSQMTGEDLCHLLEHTSDPTSLHALLSTKQLEAVMKFQEKHNEEMRRELESRMHNQLQDITRNVVPLLKVRCTDAINLDAEKYATLSSWRASEDVASLLKEGAVVRLFNISATGNRYRGAELQLSANKQTVYEPVPRSVLYHHRRVTPLSQAAGKYFSPPFGEVDIVGIVVYITCTAGSDEVYLASEDGAFLCVVFKGSIKKFGFEDILAPQNKVAACNLLWRPNTSPGHIPRVFAWECSSFCLHPRTRHLQEALKTLGLRMKADVKQFVSSCKEKIDILQQQKACGILLCDEAAAVTPERSVKTVISKVPKVVVDDIQPPSAAERKIMKLELYGEPPPLSPLVLQCPRGTFRRAFRAPQRVEVPHKRSLETTDSPPLSLESHSEDE